MRVPWAVKVFIKTLYVNMYEIYGNYECSKNKMIFI